MKLFKIYPGNTVTYMWLMEYNVIKLTTSFSHTYIHEMKC